MLPSIVIDGGLVEDPSLRFTPGGKAVCEVRVGASDSKKDDAGNWQTTERIYIGATFWEAEAEAIAELLRKGDRVTITGRLYEREYEKRDGTKGKALEVKFPSIAKKVTAPKAQRQQSQPADPASPANDPWATPGPSEPAPF